MRLLHGWWAATAAGLLCAFVSASPANAGEPDATNPKEPKTANAPEAAKDEPQTLNLLDAMRDGLVRVEAEGSGDGRMTMAITNRTRQPLRVVLPPGLVAQGATGQFGGMGGMGGGMGGMGGGMMGGGMGGMGGGMGGMGGGMGGMGGMGGGMGGGMMGGGVMPSTMGMMMLARLIMTLVGERESWDMTSLSMGMGGMGGMGMGGGMGGMGGGMGGMGMMGGMRSVPPTSLPHATFKPGQTRALPTRLVSLSQPANGTETGLAMPAKGEKLLIGDISQINDDPQVSLALKRLAALKAPQSVSQLIMWRLASGLDWETIAERSKGWANSHELSLAETFVASLEQEKDALARGETGELLIEVKGSSRSGKSKASVEESVSVLQGVLKDQVVLGLKTKLGVPSEPVGPSVACVVELGEKEAAVQVGISDGEVRSWQPSGRFTLALIRDSETGRLDGARFADALAEGILSRLVRTQLSKGPTVKGKLTYRLRIDNASPLILNGLAVEGQEETGESAKILSGICISPRKSMTVPATEEVVRALRLKKGVRVTAADLSGL
jgi:hypothetical protein